jgi:hypothetical protein
VAFSSIEIIAIVSLLGSNCMHCIIKINGTYAWGYINYFREKYLMILPRGEYENYSKTPNT